MFPMWGASFIPSKSEDEVARRTPRFGACAALELDGDGAETGRFTVTAGGRRLAALKLLVKQKRLAKNAPVPCIVKTDGVEEEDSLAENAMREALLGCRAPSWLENIRFRIEKAMIRENIELEYSHVSWLWLAA